MCMCTCAVCVCVCREIEKAYVVKVGKEEGCCSMSCAGDLSFKSLVPIRVENCKAIIWEGETIFII